MATLTKPRRHVKLLASEGDLHRLEISDGRVVDAYVAEEIFAAWGRAFRVSKPNGEAYHVNLGCIDQPATCDCKGHAYHGDCKHVKALAALVQAGKLPDPVPSTPCPANHWTDPDTLCELGRRFRPGYDD